MEDLAAFGILLGFGLLALFLSYKYGRKNSNKNPHSDGTYDNHGTFFGDDGGIDYLD